MLATAETVMAEYMRTYNRVRLFIVAFRCVNYFFHFVTTPLPSVVIQPTPYFILIILLDASDSDQRIQDRGL